MSETSQKTMQSLWTSSAEASPVKTSPRPDSRRDWTVRDPDFSMRCRESFATLDRKSGSWKTSQTSLFSDYQTFSERWPDAGMMRGGAVSAHPTWEHHIIEIGGFVSRGEWPTPLANDCDHMSLPPSRLNRDGGLPKEILISINAGHTETPQEGRPYLSADWVEMLMGFPAGWTSLDIDGQPHQGHSPQESLPASEENSPEIGND